MSDMDRLVEALKRLATALTGGNADIHPAYLEHLLEGQEFYLPDGGYSRIVVSMFSGRAFLTDNSLQRPKDAWQHCGDLVRELEEAVRVIREGES